MGATGKPWIRHAGAPQANKVHMPGQTITGTVFTAPECFGSETGFEWITVEISGRSTMVVSCRFLRLIF